MFVAGDRHAREEVTVMFVADDRLARKTLSSGLKRVWMAGGNSPKTEVT